MCTRAVGGLAHFFEEEGLPTTQISLIRLHTELTKPPRALWVSFELGRPIGMPNDPAFQKRVLLAALTLLERPSGPILEDFPEDAPISPDEITAISCPVNFAQDEVDLDETEQLCAAFKREMLSMRPWYDMAVEKRGRTTASTSTMNLDEISNFICAFLGDTTPDNPRNDVSLAFTLKLAADDLKAYYCEGITAQPNQASATSHSLLAWFWNETLAGDVLRAVKKVCQDSEDDSLKPAGRAYLVPTEQRLKVK